MSLSLPPRMVGPHRSMLIPSQEQFHHEKWPCLSPEEGKITKILLMLPPLPPSHLEASWLVFCFGGVLFVCFVTVIVCLFVVLKQGLSFFQSGLDSVWSPNLVSDF